MALFRFRIGLLRSSTTFISQYNEKGHARRLREKIVAETWEIICELSKFQKTKSLLRFQKKLRFFKPLSHRQNIFVKKRFERAKVQLFSFSILRFIALSKSHRFFVSLRPFLKLNSVMNLTYANLAKRMSAGFISVNDKNGDVVFVNTDMIVNVVEKSESKGGDEEVKYCILNLYGGELEQGGKVFCTPMRISMELKEVLLRIDYTGACNFIKIKGVNAIFNTDYSFHFSRENVATPIGMRLNAPGIEIYDQVDLVNLPMSMKGSSHQDIGDADKEKGIYWTHVNLILGLLSEGNSNYWHVCLVGGKSVRVRGPLREIIEKHPNLRNIPLVNVKDGILLNLNHTRFFKKNLIRLCDKVTIEHSNPQFSKDEFTVEKPEYKKVIEDFLHTGAVPEIHFRQKK